MNNANTLYWPDLDPFQQDYILNSKQLEIATGILSDASFDLDDAFDCIGEIQYVSSLVDFSDVDIDDAARILLDPEFCPITSLAIKQMSRLIVEESVYRVVSDIVFDCDDVFGLPTGGKCYQDRCAKVFKEVNPRPRPVRLLN